MKNFTYILATVLLSVVPFSCSKFLEEVDQDKFIPSAVDHFAALLLREFNYNPGIYSIFQMMTDEVSEVESRSIASADGDERANMRPIYTWQRNIELRADGRLANNNNPAWQRLYRQIAIANYVLEEIDEAEGSVEEIAFTKGEAYFIRAYCYFYLTNLYAEPYEDAEQARVTYGVPLRTGIGVVSTYDKNMLNECYELIEDDLAQARTLIDSSGLTKSLYHTSVKVCDLLLSTIKLYKKEYQETIDAATKVIANSVLMRIVVGTEDRPFITTNNPEVLYSFSQVDGSLGTSYMRARSLVVNPQLINSYHDDDLRKTCFFSPERDISTQEIRVYPRKGNSGYTNLGICNMRVAEAYLNRAEAYAFTNQYDKAREDLRTLLSRRYSNAGSIEIPSDNAQLVAFIFRERFKEFCFEIHHRWFDLRRMGASLRPDIVHRFSITDRDGVLHGTETYTLLKNDRNYTLSVPWQERDNNPFIRDYERFDKSPEYRGEIIF